MQTEKIFRTAVMIAAAIFASACGGSGGGGPNHETAHEGLRIVNAAPDFLDVQFQFGEFVGVLPYGENSGYLEAVEGTEPIAVRQSDEVIPTIKQDLTITAGADATYLITALAGTISGTQIADENDTITDGQFKIRFINAALSTTPIDADISQIDDGLDDSSKLATAVAFKASSEYTNIDPGTYKLRFTETGDDKQIYRSDALTFNEGEVWTVVLIEDAGGGKPLHALVLKDTQ